MLRRTRGRRAARGLALPDFLGIGAQKAGTTWLGANLERHPELFVSRPRELHFFDRHLSEGLEAYSSRFAAADGRVKGEITPAYGILPAARVRYVRRVLPRVRLLFLMRNPIERAWSHAVMDVVDRVGRRIEEVDDAELLAHLASRGNLNRGDYVRTLDTWCSVFPRQQLFVGFFEDLRDRPRQLLTDIFEFLGVTTDVDWNGFPYERVIRPGAKERPLVPPPPIPAACLQFLRERYAPQLADLRARYGERVDGWR